MEMISYEQRKQKIEYDKKVNEGRYVQQLVTSPRTVYRLNVTLSAFLKTTDEIIYTNMPKQNAYSIQRSKPNI